MNNTDHPPARYLTDVAVDSPFTFLTELGSAVAFGILLDTIIVRSVLVTALSLDLGRWMWWPSRLARNPDPAPDGLRNEPAVAMAAAIGGRAPGRLTGRDR